MSDFANDLSDSDGVISIEVEKNSNAKSANEGKIAQVQDEKVFRRSLLELRMNSDNCNGGSCILDPRMKTEVLCARIMVEKVFLFRKTIRKRAGNVIPYGNSSCGLPMRSYAE
jgi:hypothetical protein